VIALPFDLGTRTTSVVPLTRGDRSLVDPAGEVVTLTLRWPDDPAVARERNTYIAHEALLADAIASGDALKMADARTARDAAFAVYAAAMVAGWSVAAPCTPDAVQALFARFPEGLSLVVDAAGEHDRFLPESLRSSRSASEPSSPAVAG
jgi:hypothetical protein